MRVKTGVSSEGSSLIEILIATVVVGLVVTAIAVGMSHSVRNTAQSRYREVATKLAQDAQESFRRERNRLGWSQFVAVFDNPVYCFDQIPDVFMEETLANVAGACGTGQTVSVNESNVAFYREVRVVINDADGTAEVTVDMSWEDDNLEQSLSTEQVLRDWN